MNIEERIKWLVYEMYSNPDLAVADAEYWVDKAFKAGLTVGLSACYDTKVQKELETFLAKKA